MPDDDPERPWSEAADLAADWIWERSGVEGVPPLLVTNTFRNARDIDSLMEIAGGGQATPQGQEQFDPGPVLAYVPDEWALDLALSLARGFSLAVVETKRCPLAEWAAAAGAVNLLDGGLTVTEIPDDVRSDLDHVIFFGRNNGWSGPDEKQDARRYLSSHAHAGRLTPDQAVAYVMSQGACPEGAKRLRELLERELR